MHKDVVIVGAGISGIAAGYNLKKSNDKPFRIKGESYSLLKKHSMTVE